jgi:hypothetical protein
MFGPGEAGGGACDQKTGKFSDRILRNQCFDSHSGSIPHFLPFVATGPGDLHRLFESPGTNVTFGTGGVYDFNIQNGSGVAGTDYTTMSTTGTLTISATPSAPLQIVVRSIDPGTGDLGPATFNLTQAASWTLISAATIVGFNAGDFSVNTGGFQNMPGVNFVAGTNGNNLTLDFTPVPEPSTWLLLMAGMATIAIRLRSRNNS